MKVWNLEGYNGKPVVNQFVIEHCDALYFQSYKSVVIKTWQYAGERIVVFGKDWDYSKTTMKYVRRFLQAYCGLDWDAKAIRKAISEGRATYVAEIV